MGRPRVVREVSLALLLKAAALIALYWFFFAPAQRPVLDDARVAVHFMAPAPPTDATGGPR